MIFLVESFLCPDKQGTPKKVRGIQQRKHFDKNNKDEDNCPKILTDKKLKKCSVIGFWRLASAN